MEFIGYLQSYKGYFWQWEEGTDVLTIPAGQTIAYKNFVLEILERLTPQGIPPFGALLLAIIATNESAGAALEIIPLRINQCIGIGNDANNEMLDNAMRFLHLLSQLPPKYKRGSQRLLLMQAIFQDCHNAVGAKNAQRITQAYTKVKHGKEKLAEQQPFHQQVFQRDFKPLALIGGKLTMQAAILERIASIPVLEELLFLPPDEIADTLPDERTLVDKLIDNDHTFHIGALIKRLWGGLNIPVHTTLPSGQPLGGVSDLTNKGSFDKLLISEFANDDMVLLSRLANNEALYLHREVPPENNQHHRVFLIDVSIKNWGTPKTLAFATMLAITNHPKAEIAYSCYVVGNSYKPVFINDVHNIIEACFEVDSCLHPAIGLQAFFKDMPADKNRELFFISSNDTCKHPAMMRLLADYRQQLNFCIYTNAEGAIDVYKMTMAGSKQLQHLQLALADLWRKNEPRPIAAVPKSEQENSYPILFKNSSDVKKYMTTASGEVFMVTGDKSLMRYYTPTNIASEKGWEMVYQQLPFSAIEYEIGQLENGDFMLLMYHGNKKEITLINITTNKSNSFLFEHWKSVTDKSFAFYKGKFYHQNYKTVTSIDTNGDVICNAEVDRKIFGERRMANDAAIKKYTTAYSVFKNVSNVFISDLNTIAFNKHHLLVENRHFKLTENKLPEKIKAQKVADNEFAFSDGSVIQVNRNGMLIFKSSNQLIPVFYISSVLNASLGAATAEEFAGNMYYYKEPLYTIGLVETRAAISAIKLLKEETGMGLADAKILVDSRPCVIFRNVNFQRATKLKEAFVEAQTTVTIIQSENACTEHTISTELFMKRYITPFIKHILNHATKPSTISQK